MRFYATQYGYYWRLTEDQLRKACEGIVKGEGYQLEPLGAREVKHKPRFAKGVFVFDMLDWDAEPARKTIEELDAHADHFSCASWVWRA